MTEHLTGLDKALILGSQAATKLEYTAKPTLKDKKDARDLFKRAAKIMDNVVGLEEEDVFETGPKPDPEPERPSPGPALFTPDGGPAIPPPMPEEAPEPAPSLPTLHCSGEVIEAEILSEADTRTQVHEADAKFDATAPEERKDLFLALLSDLESAGQAEGLSLKEWPAALQAWGDAWEADPRGAFRAVWNAYYEAPEISWDAPTLEAQS